MVVLLVGGILRILEVLDIVEAVQARNVTQIKLFLRVVASIFRQQGVDAIHRTVAVAVSILESVACLQIQMLRDGFRIREAPVNVIGLGGRQVILVGKGAAILLVVVDLGAAPRLVVGIGVASAGIQGQVTACLAQSAVQLQVGIKVGGVTLALGATQVVVDGDTTVTGTAVVLCIVVRKLIQRVVVGVIWVGVEGGTHAVAVIARPRMGEIGTEHEVRQCVGLPLETQVGIDVLVPADG